MKTSKEIRNIFINFMKKNGHAIIPNVSLVPINDPSLLFVNSGMFPLVNYLMGEEHPEGKRLANFQRCIRTEDIEEVGDSRHHTMFEMIGNWSLNDYFKEEQLQNFMKLYVEEFSININRIYVSVFKGDDSIPRDDESISIWKKIFKQYGIEAKYTENPYDILNPDYRIFGLDRHDNWWQRGKAVGELGGPDSEMYYDLGVLTNPDFKGKHAINDDSGRFLEIGNSVFMEYRLVSTKPDEVELNKNLQWEKLPIHNVDFGGGFERIMSVIQGVTDNYDTDLFIPIIKKIEEISGKKWKDEDIDDLKVREIQNFNFRSIADHIRAGVFIIADGVVPANKEHGYILRRLIRRMVRKAKNLGIEENFTRILAGTVIEKYRDTYPHLKLNERKILNELEKEELNFRKTLERGLKELQKITARGVKLTGSHAFRIYETYGFPLEMIIEELEDQVNDPDDFGQADRITLEKEFNDTFLIHQNKSRKGVEKKFKGGLADKSEQVTKLHTAHHLLLASLKQVLGNHVKQRGSNITHERLRIDFSHNEKLTKEELAKVENLVNEKIQKKLSVEKKIMPKEEAEKIGAEMEFGNKYGDLVTVYFIKDQETGEIFSKEFCSGPHVINTHELGKFKIIKEESSGAGIRRIKAVLTADNK